ncbi:MAG: alpha/beta fold hydrolase [Marmoricola sp.]
MHELLWAAREPDQVAAVVLYLHGGTVRSVRPVTRSAATYQRARLLRDALAPSLARDDIASALLRYNVRGWNAKAGEPAPLADARWAIDQVVARHDVPVVLVGHSMGARTGLAVAQHPSVIGLVALAPWFPANEDVSPLTGRHLAVLHGTNDRITSPRESRIVAERAASVASSMEYIALPGLGHYLIADAAAWHRGARHQVRRILEAHRQAAV